MIAVVPLLSSCGGGGDSAGGGGGGGAQATIDSQSVVKSASHASQFVPVCSTASTLVKSYSAQAGLMAGLATARQLEAARSGPVVKAFTGTTPADVFGACGGRTTYPSYSHSNGVTTATVLYDHYCTIKDSATGSKQIINGSFSFVNTGTPTANGPITSRLDASSSGAVTIQVTDSVGTQLSLDSYRITNFAYVYGVPGGTPTASNPDTLSADTIAVTHADGTSSTQTNYRFVMFRPAAGGAQYSVSGRGFDGSGNYYDIATTVPIVTNSSGNTLSGTLTYTGAAGSNAVVTMVPGLSMLKATVTVNGTPVTALPACS